MHITASLAPLHVLYLSTVLRLEDVRDRWLPGFNHQSGLLCDLREDHTSLSGHVLGKTIMQLNLTIVIVRQDTHKVPLKCPDCLRSLTSDQLPQRRLQ